MCERRVKERMSFKENLQDAMASAGVGPTDIGNALGISSQAVSQWISGKTHPTGKRLKDLAIFLGTSWEELHSEKGSRREITKIVHAPSYITIPEYDVVTSAGPGAVPQLCSAGEGLSPAEHWQIPRTYISAFSDVPDKLAIIRVAGDSMEPEYQAGDRVLIDTSHCVPSPPGVYVLWDGYGLVLKRLELLPGMEEPRRVRIMSINSAYSTYELTLDEISINGRVIGKWAWK